MGEIFKKFYFTIFVFIFMFTISGSVFAESDWVNARILKVYPRTDIVRAEYYILKGIESDGYEEWVYKTLDIPTSKFGDAGIDLTTLESGNEFKMSVADNGDVEEISPEMAWTDGSKYGSGFQKKGTWDTSGYQEFKLFKIYCKSDQALVCWTDRVFEFSQTAILLLSTAVVVGSGIIYMTSAGDPKRVAIAKRFLIGAFSGVAVIVLGRFFLTKVVGVPWL